MPSIKWSYTTGYRVESSPAIGADGTIYVGSGDGKLYAINSAGTLKWSCTIGYPSSPAIGADGTVYVGSSDHKLYAIGPNGTLKWSYVLGGMVLSSPAIGADGTVYVGSLSYMWYGQGLYAMNPSGTLKWCYTTEYSIESGPAIGADGTVYVGSNYGDKLYAVNPDGTLRWSYTTSWGEHSTPAIADDGTVYVGSILYDGSLGGKLYAINPDGTLKWSYSTQHGIESSPAIAVDGTIYVGSNCRKLHAVNPDGTLKWSYTFGNPVKSSPAIGADGTIYVASDDGKLHAVNPDGTLKWSYTIGAQIWSSPAIGADGTVYIGSNDYKLYAIHHDTIAPAAVADLAPSATTVDAVTLTWSAPGDDEDKGTASKYDLRYSTSPIVEATWHEADQATGLPAPQPARTTETHTVEWLLPGTTYYFALKTSDEVSNSSELSNVVSVATEALPAHCDLTISSTAGGLVTVPGEGLFTYAGGAIVSLVTQADSGHAFVGWTGDVRYITDVRDASTSITMMADYSIVANFRFFPPPSNRSLVRSLDHLSEDSYFFNEYIFDPGVPLLGEEQSFSIWARHAVGIDTVTVTVSYKDRTYPDTEETVELHLVEGTQEEGRWQGSWIVKSDPGWYPNYTKVLFRVWDNDGIEGPQFSILGTLSREGSPPEFEFEPDRELDLEGYPSPRATQYSISGPGYPSPRWLVIDPFYHAREGEIQILAIRVVDPKGVQAVTATYKPFGEEKKVVVDLKLLQGTPQDGWWMGGWQLRYYPPSGMYYNITFDAFNTDGDSHRSELSVLAYPTIVSTWPEGGAIDAAIDTVVSATFDRAMLSSDVTTNTFTLNGVAGVVSYDSNTYTARLMPSTDLEYSTTYTAILSGSIRSSTGWPSMIMDYSWSFTTRAAPVCYDLAVSSTNGGSVTVPGEGSFYYEEGTVVDLVASPDTGYRSVNWAGDVYTIANVTSASTTITMNGDYSIIANFAAIPHYELVTSSTEGGAVTAPGEGTFSYDEGTMVNLVASPASGYRFVNWTGDVGTIADANSATTTITMNDNYSITANFEALAVVQTQCVETATGTGLAYFTPSQGFIEGLAAIPPHSLPSVLLPHGMFSFKITGLTPGQTVTLTIEFPSPLPIGTLWWKYDNGHWYGFPNENDSGDNVMVIKLTDGGIGDFDNIPGQITDPGGPGNPMTVGWDTSPIHRLAVLAPWIAWFAVVMCGASVLVLRRRSKMRQHA